MLMNNQPDAAIDIFALHSGKCRKQFEAEGEHCRILEKLSIGIRVQ